MLVGELNDANGNLVRLIRIPQTLEDVTVGRYIEWNTDILPLCPPEDALENDWLLFHSKVVSFWCGVSDNEVSQMAVEEILNISGIITHALNFDGVKQADIVSFDLNNDRYHLPKKGIAIVGDMNHYLQNITLGEWATVNELRRAFDLMGKGEIEGVLLIIAVLCRKDGETFPINSNEQTKFIKERTELFKALDMQTALSVAFFLTKRNENLRAYFHALPEAAKVVQLVKNTAIT